MGNLYDYFASLIGYAPNAAQNGDILQCACIAVVVLFVVSIKLILRGFDRLFGYHNM